MLDNAFVAYNKLLSDYEIQYTNFLCEKRKIEKCSRHNCSDLFFDGYSYHDCFHNRNEKESNYSTLKGDKEEKFDDLPLLEDNEEEVKERTGITILIPN